MKRKNDSYGDVSGICKLRIDDILRDRGLSQNWLACEMGVSESTISRAIKSENLSIPMLANMAKVLTLEVGDLFARTKWYRKPVESTGECIEEICDENSCRREKKMNNGVFQYDVIENPSAMETSECDPWLDTRLYNKLCKTLCVERSVVDSILCGHTAVTPLQWYDMCKVLKDKAFVVMPRIHVCVEMNVIDGEKGLSLDESVLDKRVFKTISV